MTLSEKLRASGRSIKGIARELHINPVDIHNFLRHRFHKISKSRRRLIRSFFIDQGWLARPKPRPRHKCPACKSVHVIKHDRQLKKTHAAPQSLSDDKNSSKEMQ